MYLNPISTTISFKHVRCTSIIIAACAVFVFALCDLGLQSRDQVLLADLRLVIETDLLGEAAVGATERLAADVKGQVGAAPFAGEVERSGAVRAVGRLRSGLLHRVFSSVTGDWIGCSAHRLESSTLDVDRGDCGRRSHPRHGSI